MKWITALAASVGMMATAASAQDATQADQATDDTDARGIEMMVLGTYHFNNPGLDMVNIESDDVLTPRRQAELEAMTDALAEWKPTKILVEAQPSTDDLHMKSFREEPEKRIAEDRNEHFQIGYRLAMKLGHSDVYGFDEKSSEGEPDYFPMQTVISWAQANDAMAEFGALAGQVEAIAKDLSKDQDRCSLARNLIGHNDPKAINQAHGLFYYGLLPFGDAEAQPGAEVNAYWYMRNAKMFAKADLIAEPGDRVLIIVGSGHKYWLDHFAEMAVNYSLVDPRPYLERADTGGC